MTPETLGYIYLGGVVVFGLGCSFAAGYFGDDDAGALCLLALIWPVLFVIAAVVLPFVLAYKLGMLINQEWLYQKIAADPEGDCEIVPTKGMDVEELRKVIRAVELNVDTLNTKQFRQKAETQDVLDRIKSHCRAALQRGGE